MRAKAVEQIHATAGVIGGAPSSGASFLAQAVRGIEARLAEARRRGEIPTREVVIFDIDNTLVDTRYRTLEALRRFGKRECIQELASLKRDDVEIDAATTVSALKLGRPGLEIAAQAFWRDFFWRPSSFDLDRPLDDVIAWAKRAADAGAEVIYLTGRNQTLADATAQELRRIGAPLPDNRRLLTKPVGSDTSEFKVSVMRKLLAEANVSWFLSDSRHELAFVCQKLPTAPCVRAAFPIGPAVPALDPRMPVLE